MLDSEIKNIHVLQSKNVKYLKKAEKILRMDLNRCLLKNDEFQLNIKTKYYSMLYSSVSESQFLQILYTPYGFDYSEIQKIEYDIRINKKGKEYRKKRSLIDSWNLIVDIAIRKVGNPETSKDLKEKKGKIKAIIKEYIEKPQELRNKIAHGQWIHAFNNENTRENEKTSKRIKELNFIQIYIWFEIHQYLCFIIRDLIQSPKKTFHNSYWEHLSKLEEFIKRSKRWTIEGKLVELNKRKQKTDVVTMA